MIRQLENMKWVVVAIHTMPNNKPTGPYTPCQTINPLVGAAIPKWPKRSESKKFVINISKTKREIAIVTTKPK